MTPFKAYTGKDPLLNYESDTADGILEREVPAAIERVQSIYNARISLEKSWVSIAKSYIKFYNRKYIL